MTYRHGVYTSEVPTSILAPVRVSAGLPVAVGIAPINMTDNPAEKVNKPVLVYTYAEAVAAMGFIPAGSNGKFAYSLCEVIKSHFALFQVAPLVLINVLDPATHKATVADETAVLVGDKVTLANAGVIKSTLVVKDSTATTTYVEDDDYVLTFDSAGKTVINRVAGGAIDANESLKVAYDRIDPSAVDAADIIGGVDVSGKLTGLELVNEVYPRFRLVPGQVIAPGYSTDSGVAAVMNAKAENVNSFFSAISICDLSTVTADSYTEAPALKESSGLAGPSQVVCWPKVALGGEQYHLSTQLAGLICKTDGQNSDVPFMSPSNKNLAIDSSVLDSGAAVFLGPEQANYLNGNGIVTALNFSGGWVAWGNRTAAYPGNTDPKDSFIPVRRMFGWVANTLTLTFWQRLDFPLNKRQIQTVVDSANLFLNGLVAQGYLIGARVEFLEAENPQTDLMDGIARFHVYLTPPSPNREIDFIVEYDPSYLNSLFA